MSYTSTWDSDYVYLTISDDSISLSPKSYSFNKNEYELIIKDDKYILIPKEEKEEVSNLPDSIPEELFEL